MHVVLRDFLNTLKYIHYEFLKNNEEMYAQDCIITIQLVISEL